MTFNTKPAPEGSWTVKYEPITMQAFGNLRYERWVKDRREQVDTLSGGRVGYLHIKAMDQPSLAKFKKDLAEFRHKEGLVDRPALERRRQYRAGTVGDPGSAPL